MNFYIPINRWVLSITIILVSFSTIHAQLKINTYSYFVDDAIISETQRVQIEATVLETMNLYYEAANLIDNELLVVTSTSVRRFEDLFQPKTRIVNDLTTGVKSHYSDYASSVLGYLPKEGVKFKMEYGIILEMEYEEEEGIFQISVQAQKTVYTGLSYTNKPEYCKDGREYDLEFHLEIDENDLKTAKFSKITGTVTRRCEDLQPLIGFGIRGASDIAQNSVYQASSFLETQMGGLVFTPNAAKSIGAGFCFQMPILKQGVYINVGVDYSIFNLSGMIEGNYIKVDDILTNATITGTLFDNTPVVLNKMVEIQGGQENINTHTLQLPIGLRYRNTFSELDKLSIIADVLFVPTLHLFSNANLSVDKVIYSGVMDTNPDADLEEDIVLFFSSDANLDILGFGVGEDINAIQPEIQKELSFNLRLAPGIQYEIADYFFVEFMIDYTLGLTSFLNHETIGETGNSYFLEGQEDVLSDLGKELNQSFMESYLDETKISNIGLRLGLSYMLH